VLRDSQRLAEQLKQAQTTTITVWFETVLKSLRGEREAAFEAAARLQAITDAHGFDTWKDVALVTFEAIRSAHLDAAGLSELHRRLMGIRNAAWRRVVCLCLLTELCIEAGSPDVGRVALGSMREEDRTAILAPEILRLEGELHLQAQAPDAAERCFRDAIDPRAAADGEVARAAGDDEPRASARRPGGARQGASSADRRLCVVHGRTCHPRSAGRRCAPPTARRVREPWVEPGFP
jgi:uncharacterized small protein (DUF1192 family)